VLPPIVVVFDPQTRSGSPRRGGGCADDRTKDAVMRREVKWAAAGAIVFAVLLEVFGVLERLPWWLFLPLCLAIGALAAYVGEAIWHWRRREK
jgi:hypothetical protein